MTEATYKELSEAYGIKEYDISIAVNRAGLDPKGRRNGPPRSLRTWDPAEVVNAVVDLLRKRARSYTEKAEKWNSEANRLEKAVKQDV